MPARSRLPARSVLTSLCVTSRKFLTSVPSPVVMRRRERVPLPLDPQLVLVELATDLGPRLLVHVALGQIRERRRVGGRRHLVRVVIVDPGCDPFLLGQAGQLVVVEMPGTAAVLP